MSPGTTTPASPTDSKGRTLRTDVLVNHEGRWCPGKLRAWRHTSDGQQSALVTWSPVPGQIRIDRLPAEQLHLA